MDKRGSNIVTAFAIAIVLWIIIFIGGSIVPMDSFLSRVFQVMGSAFPPEGLIQFFTFWLFFFGMLEIYSTSKKITDEEFAYNFRLLPETEQYVLSPKDVNNIKLNVLKQEKKHKNYILTDLIKKGCTKYRANKSTSEALEIVSAQVRINMNSAESQQSMIRYVAWAIPSVGFIGTIIGIANSLGNVKSEMSSEDIQLVTNALYVAFDTTLLSLLLSIILMLYFHVIQERVEQFHLNMEEYVIENLINRIYKL